ncbi:MAG: pirin family protein [Gordonia sp. (in: high G+C Gram-positive bacteria)]|uniref:pirin family protein n=1 Tax=Gordonia sp. (in: high G+C Gram-positive bacteria) TaxID=84139 RepID=UPI003BB62ED9
MTTSATVIRAADRLHWTNEWLTSRQSFPATGNYDLFGNAHGVLLVHNDDVVGPGEGLDAHQHQNTEILTWVVNGAVAHRDSQDHAGVLPAGTLGYMSAGRGITHSEGNADRSYSGAPLRVIQMWVAPDTDGLDPTHAEKSFTDALASGEPVVAASGRREHRGHGALPISNRFAALHLARPRSGQRVSFPGAPFGHLFVVDGQISVDSVGVLAAGDALRTVDHSALAVTAAADAELIFWEMHASFEV